MAEPRMRPRFTHPLAIPPAAFHARLREALEATGGRLRGNVFESGAILRIREEDRHFWSPALHVFVETDAGGRAILHGRFSPSSPVWTAFLAIYLALACAGIAAACYGGAQWTLDQQPWAFLGVPVALGLAAFTYGAAFIGQGLGNDDMYELRSFCERVADGVPVTTTTVSP